MLCGWDDACVCCFGDAVFRSGSEGDFQWNLVLYLSLCHVAYAGDLPVSDSPDCGNTSAAVLANCQRQYYRAAAAVIKKPVSKKGPCKDYNHLP